MDHTRPQTFMSLLTGDGSERDGAPQNMNAVPTMPNWQFSSQTPQPYAHPMFSQPPLLSQNSQVLPHLNYMPNYPSFVVPPPNPTPTPSQPQNSQHQPQNSQPNPPPPPTSTTTDNVLGSSKWTLEEDRRLVTSWINVSTNPLVGADQKKSGFWTQVASMYNLHAPTGAAKRNGKVCNARWSRAAPLVQKWTSFVAQAYRASRSGANEDDVMQHAHDLYFDTMKKRFDLQHWWVLLKDQPKWEVFCDQSNEAANKRLRLMSDAGGQSDAATYATPSSPVTEPTPALEIAPHEESGGLIRPIGRKAAKRKLKEKAHDEVLQVLTKELSKVGSSSVKNSSLLERYVQAQEEKAKAKREMVEVAKEAMQLQRAKYEDKILRMNVAEMCPEDQARYAPLQEEIRSRYRRFSSSTSATPSLD